jgi:hypothetical protein
MLKIIINTKRLMAHQLEILEAKNQGRYDNNILDTGIITLRNYHNINSTQE